jgi:MFS family permease
MIEVFSAEPAKRATYTGLSGMTYRIAAIAGPLVGGGLTEGASWR